MRDLLTDTQSLRSSGKEARPLLIRTPRGVRVRTQEGIASSSHVDHTLAVLAEVGTPLDYPLITSRGPRAVGAMLLESLQDFSLNQVEYEWSTLVYALYSVDRSWQSREGQQITYERLAHRLMRQAPGQGVCYGNHRLYGLVALLRIDEQSKILELAVRREVDHLPATHDGRTGAEPKLGRILQRQLGGAGAAANRLAIPPDSLTGRLLVTGHALEWWALAPAEVLPPRETLIRAGQWLCCAVAELDARVVSENYSYLTHAGRRWRVGGKRLRPRPSTRNSSIRRIRPKSKNNSARIKP